MLDVLTSPVPVRAPGPYERALGADPRTLRVGVLAPSSLPTVPDDAVARSWSNAAAVLDRAGIAVVDVAFPDLAALNALAGVVFLSEAAAVHATELRRASERYGPQVRERLLQGLLLPAAAYIGALQVRAGWCARWQRAVFTTCDVLLIPVAPTPAPLRSYYASTTDTGKILEHNGRLGSYTPAFNYLGLPVLAVPTGGTLGMQLVAAPQRDADAICIGAALESGLRA
jgi:aspartyl-tRNA(Asn)/glutamyl-tRNA(Gln) amidotransferase subunit A